jgi:lysophospholipid acyltransferase (LPLAT)-like uncharacterized protein
MGAKEILGVQGLGEEPVPAPAPKPERGPARKTQVHALSGWRRAVLWPLAMVVLGWTRTLRIELSPVARHQLGKVDEPVVFALWHNRLFVAAEMFRRHQRGRDVYGLVSTSRDGAWLEAFFSLVGMRSVRGSSSRRGREAALGLVDVLRAGNDIGVTPDGPRGPRYEFKAGLLVVARRARVPVVLFGAAYEAAWALPSWDGFLLPHPFSRVRVSYDKVLYAQLAGAAMTTEQLEARLRVINPDAGMARVAECTVV